jgi:hypothetical protein
MAPLQTQTFPSTWEVGTTASGGAREDAQLHLIRHRPGRKVPSVRLYLVGTKETGVRLELTPAPFVDAN